jgi:hypothetical protein
MESQKLNNYIRGHDYLDCTSQISLPKSKGLFEPLFEYSENRSIGHAAETKS